MAMVRKATATDKMMMVPIIGRVLGAAIMRLLTSPFRSGKRAKKLFKDVVFAALRVQLSNVNPAQEQLLNPTTESVYKDCVKKNKLKADTSVLDSGLKVHWLGKKTAEKVILYFHGGGYALSASAGHFQWLYELQQELNKSHSVSVAVPAYTLAPTEQYPFQMRQAAESLEWLIGTMNKKPSDIIVAGDSAGGNLALGLISHLIHPHPEIANKIHINMTEPLAGLILISPWCNFATDDDSVKRNQQSDMVTPKAADRWSSLFLGKSPADNYNQPITADLTWFNGLDLRVKEILIWGGGGEVLIDSINAMAKKLKDAHSRTEYVVEPGAAHEDFIMDKLLGYKGKAEGTKVIESWISERI